MAGNLLLAEQRPYPRWSKIELVFEGPESKGMGQANPFAIPFDIRFFSPDGKAYLVPGFYDGNGAGGLDGHVWKVRFSADRNGVWRYQTRSASAKLNNRKGSFKVTDPPPGAPEFYRSGRLEYVGQRYLKFREGGYWIKFGADEPENLLGRPFGDWDAKKRQMDYLASRGINCIYVMANTVDGDGKDVWPWVGRTQEEAKQNDGRFDLAKLDRWRDFFEYVQASGIVIHLVLEDDSAWSGYDHARYYREIVARFGYLPALYFNFCEEYNERYSLDEALGYLKILAETDPYNHPRAIHNVRVPLDPYIDSPYVDLTSIQTDPKSSAALNQLATDWWSTCLARKRRPLVVSFDEARPAEDRRSWWSAYLAGGMWETYIPVPKGYAAAEPAWRYLAATRRFMEKLPVERMLPANHLLRSGNAVCLAEPGAIYALYLPQGGTVDMALAEGNQYQAQWYNPRGPAANPWIPAAIRSNARFTAPDSQDWALLIRKVSGHAGPAPSAVSARLHSMRGQPIKIFLPAFGAEKAGYAIISPPRHGTLSGTGAERVYTPDPNFTGRDEFRWRAGASNVATISIIANASGSNAPPHAQDQSITVVSGRPQSYILSYTDEDGRGPYDIRIVTQPKHGRISGLGNDLTYTPGPAFTGTDTMRWRVSDGQAWSNIATVTISVEQEYFPPPDLAGGWRVRAPRDPGKLDQAFEAAKLSTKHGGLLVVHHGWLIYEKYFGRGHRDAVPNTASCGKSFTAVSLAILAAERPDLFPDGLDQKVFTPAYLPPEAFPLRDSRMSQITLGELLSMTAGIPGNNPGYVYGRKVSLNPPGPDGWPAMVDSNVLSLGLWCDPGEGYSYATASIHLASIILRHVTGMELQEFVRRRLAEPMGWGRWGWGYRQTGIPHTPGGGGIAVRATDMLRFAYLLLHEGRWRDKQLVPVAFIRECGSVARHNPHYPFTLGFESNEDGHIANVPRDAIWKQGSGGHAVYMVPSLDLAVWKLGGRDEQYDPAQTGLAALNSEHDGSRENWKASLDVESAMQKTLQLVVAAVQQ